MDTTLLKDLGQLVEPLFGFWSGNGRQREACSQNRGRSSREIVNGKHVAQSLASITEPIKDACLAEYVGGWAGPMLPGLPTCLCPHLCASHALTAEGILICNGGQEKVVVGVGTG